MIEPENGGCSDADGGHESVSASVVAGVDAPRVLEIAEHVLDPMALALEPMRPKPRGFHHEADPY
jgi:hypothetical protein